MFLVHGNNSGRMPFPTKPMTYVEANGKQTQVRWVTSNTLATKPWLLLFSANQVKEFCCLYLVNILKRQQQ